MAHWTGSLTWERPEPRRKGVGDRSMASLFAPGSQVIGSGASAWSGDRYQQVLRYTYFTYIAVKAICEEIAGLTPQVGFLLGSQDAAQRDPKRFLAERYRRKALIGARDSDEIEPAGPNDPLARLLQNPNEPDVSWTFWYRVALYLELTGNSYIMKFRNGLGIVEQMYVIPAHWVRAIGGIDRLVDGYEIRPFGGYGGAKSMYVDAKDMIHIAYPGPLSVMDGWSPLQATAMWSDTAQSMDVSRLAAFKRGVRTDLILTLDPSFGNPSDEELDRFLEKIEKRYSGEAKTARPIAVPSGIGVHQVGRTPAEMDYIASGEQSMNWNMATHRVSHAIAGITHDQDYAGMIASLAGFRQSTIKPKLTLMGQVLTENLAREQDARKCVYWPDPTPVDPVQRNADITTRFATGAITANEIRQEFGDKAFEYGGDDPVLPMGVGPVPWGTGIETAEADPVGFDEPIDADEPDEIDAPEVPAQPAATPGTNGKANGKLTHAMRF